LTELKPENNTFMPHSKFQRIAQNQVKQLEHTPQRVIMNGLNGKPVIPNHDVELPSTRKLLPSPKRDTEPTALMALIAMHQEDQKRSVELHNR
jgi:hypothetical protein